jgi:sigma-B regulation protein RsbU (phosphoserine phosphatase)
MGDVMGHGIRAAALMGTLRSALRAYALDGAAPAVVLTRLDRFLEHLALTEIATVLYLILDADASSGRFASAGHPSPFVRAAGSAPAPVPGGVGPPLGVWTEAVDESEFVLPAGATLVLFTDGPSNAVASC